MIDRAGAYAKRDTGMAIAVAKADRDRHGWSDQALSALEKFCRAHESGMKFLAEEVRAWGEELGLVDPPENAKSWGAVFQRAARLNIIRRVGYAPSASSNMSPKCLWRAK